MKKEAVRMVNTLKQWQKSFTMLRDELIGDLNPETGAIQVNGDESLAEKISEVEEAINARIGQIKAEGYIPKKKYKE